MVTGDNALTSLSVAKQCDILEKSTETFILDTIVKDSSLHASTLDGITMDMADIARSLSNSKQYVVTGAFFHHFIEPMKN